MGVSSSSPSTTHVASPNHVYVVPERPCYVGGEVVSGMVYASIVEPVPSQGILIKLKGSESVHWTEQRSRTTGSGKNRRTTHYTVHFRGHRTVFCTRIPVFSVPGLLLCGNFAIPFSVVLPPFLPGSIALVSGFSGDGHVKYSLKAEVHSTTLPKSNVKHKVPLVIIERLKGDIVPSIGESTSSVRLCCCINKGSVWMRGVFDKNAYTMGETATVVLEIDNRSTIDVDMVSVQLYQTREYTSSGGHRRVFSRQVSSTDFPGFPKSTALRGADARRIPLSITAGGGEGLLPSTSGTVINISYFIIVECAITCAPDAQFRLPVTVYGMLPGAVPVPTAPAGWLPTMLPAVTVDLKDMPPPVQKAWDPSKEGAAE